MMRDRLAARLGLVALLAGGCNGGGTPENGSAPSTASASAASAASVPSPSASATIPAPSATAERKPYEGPTGTLHGVIRIKGDPAPETPHVYPKECGGEAASMYGRLFRAGQDGALADAVVAVTGYDGFVPAKNPVIGVSARRCTYSTRSIAMTDGQHLEVTNLDKDTTSYIPWLDGARLPATIVAMPLGAPVKLYSRGYQRYWLRDQLGRTFMVAHVFHLRYSTTAVTGVDGAYRIEGIPVGKVDVSAMLPSANLLSITKPFEIKPGEDNVLDLELTFDAKKHVPAVPEDKLSDSGNEPRPMRERR